MTVNNKIMETIVSITVPIGMRMARAMNISVESVREQNKKRIGLVSLRKSSLRSKIGSAEVSLEDSGTDPSVNMDDFLENRWCRRKRKFGRKVDKAATFYRTKKIICAIAAGNVSVDVERNSRTILNFLFLDVFVRRICSGIEAFEES